MDYKKFCKDCRFFHYVGVVSFCFHGVDHIDKDPVNGYTVMPPGLNLSTCSAARSGGECGPGAKLFRKARFSLWW